MNLDENKWIDNYLCLIDIDAFGMENIFEQMRKYKGKNIITNIFSYKQKQSRCLEEADQLTGDERKDFAEKVL